VTNATETQYPSLFVRSAAESRAVFGADDAPECTCHENYHEMGVHAPDWRREDSWPR